MQAVSRRLLVERKTTVNTNFMFFLHDNNFIAYITNHNTKKTLSSGFAGAEIKKIRRITGEKLSSCLTLTQNIFARSCSLSHRHVNYTLKFSGLDPAGPLCKNLKTSFKLSHNRQRYCCDSSYFSWRCSHSGEARWNRCGIRWWVEKRDFIYIANFCS